MALIKCRECGKRLSTEAATCPHCGAPNKTTETINVAARPASDLLAKVRAEAAAESQRKGKRREIIAAVVVGIAVLITHLATRPPPARVESVERYGALNNTPNSDVARAAVASGVRGCGEYRWQAVLNRPGDIRVYCSADGERYTGYRIPAGTSRMESDHSTMDPATQDALYPHSKIR